MTLYLAYVEVQGYKKVSITLSSLIAHDSQSDEKAIGSVD
jgi:hypothetical protein